jgi:predicted site-specific integrase-resolvase
LPRWSSFAWAAALLCRGWVREIGGGMNRRRPKFTAFMGDVHDGRVSMLLVARKDRLARSGFGYLERVAACAGCEIVVADQLSLSPGRELAGTCSRSWPRSLAAGMACGRTARRWRRRWPWM